MILPIYIPTAAERKGSRREKVLWLRGGGAPLRRRDSDYHMPAAVVCYDDVPVTAGVFRVVGVDEELDYEYEPQRSEYRVFRDADGRMVRSYGGLLPGPYEAISVMSSRSNGEERLHRALFEYDTARGFVLHCPKTFASLWRGERRVDFGEVRSLVAEGFWDRALRAACWLPDPGAREAAIHYVESNRRRRGPSLDAARRGADE